MFTLIGENLPQIVGLIISPATIIMAIVLLTASNGMKKAWLMCLGGFVGVIVLTFAFSFLGSASTTSNGRPPTWQGWFDLVAGFAFIALLVPQLKALRHPNPAGPKWLDAIDSIGALPIIGIGLVQGALNPKSIALLMHLGLTAGNARFSPVELGTYIVIVGVLAMIPILVPIGIAQFSGAEGVKILHRLHTFMTKNSAIIMVVLFVVLAALFISKSIEILAG